MKGEIPRRGPATRSGKRQLSKVNDTVITVKLPESARVSQLLEFGVVLGRLFAL
jgi:hypothetical protein